LSPTDARSAPNRRDSLLNAYISAYQAKDARAYLSLFSQDADYVDFAVQVHAKISQLKGELASSFRREAFYLSLFSQDADYVDFAVQVHAKISQLKGELASSFRREAFRLVFHSSFLSADGKSAALQGTYNDSARGGEPASVPIASFLQIADGKITREAIYYDGSLFKRHLHAA